MGTEPTGADAIRIVESVTGHKVKNITRFQTGKAHYVYDVEMQNEQLVIRITKAEWVDVFAGAVYWYPILEKNGVPLPALRACLESLFLLQSHHFGYNFVTPP